MEADDVLADDMHLSRPEALELVGLHIREADSGQVVGERVDPHIHDVFRIAGHRNAPVEGGARDGKVLQTAAHEALHFVGARLGANELRVRLVMGKQLRLIG